VKNDATYLAIIFGLFVLAFLFVRVCDRIIGTDDEALAEQGGTPEPTEQPEEQVAA
jgi:hypothetical protein